MSDMVLALPVLGFVLLRFAPFLTCSTKTVPPSSKLVSDIPTILESNSLRFSVMLGSIIRPTVLASTHPHLLRVLVSTSFAWRVVSPFFTWIYSSCFTFARLLLIRCLTTKGSSWKRRDLLMRTRRRWRQ